MGTSGWRYEDVTDYSEPEMETIRKKVTMVFQNGALFDSLTVGENVAFPLRERGGLEEEQIYQIIDGLLDMVGVREFRDQLPSDLSTGMKRSVAIARALAAQPDAVLYDEPTTMVDPLMAHLLGDLIKKLKQQLKLTSIVVTHDMALAKKLADRLLFLHEARAIFFGTFAEMAEMQRSRSCRSSWNWTRMDFERYFGAQRPQHHGQSCRQRPKILAPPTARPSTPRPGHRACVHFSRYLATMSVSMFTGSPGLSDSRLVILTVCGMMAMVSRRPSSFATVRLMPSIAIDPLKTTYFSRSSGMSMSSQKSSALANGLEPNEAAGAIHVALHDVAAHAAIGLQRQFEIDLAPSVMRENEVRVQVSAARSAQKVWA